MRVECNGTFVEVKPCLSNAFPLQGLRVEITMPREATLTISAIDDNKILKKLYTRWGNVNHTKSVKVVEGFVLKLTIADLTPHGDSIEFELELVNALPWTYPEPSKLSMPLHFKVGDFGVVVTKEERLTPQPVQPTGTECLPDMQNEEGLPSKRARGAP